MPSITPEPPDLDPSTSLDVVAFDQFLDKASFEDSCIDAGSESPLNARGISLSMCKVSRTAFLGSTLPGFRSVDCRFERADASAATWVDARLVRCRFDACKCTGFDLRGGALRDVVFYECKMPDAFMSESTLDRVRFESCHMPGLDFTGAALSKVVIHNCDARNLRLLDARIDTLDLRGSDIEGIAIDAKSLNSIIIDPTQAPALARAMGIRVSEIEKSV